MDEFARNFATLFAVIDPIGTLPIFLSVTSGMATADRRRTAIRATVISTVILLVFVVAGQYVLGAMGISLASYKVAGGIVLLLFALQMIFHPGEAPDDEHPLPRSDVAVFPLAIPSIAGPAAMMAVVVLTDNDRYNFMQQLDTVTALLVVLAITLVIMLAASPIQKLIGDSGVSIVRRVMGLLLAALAVQTMVDGMKVLMS
jgi:multiple antibiotic resistance protein